jgi:hypothetical protein
MTLRLTHALRLRRRDLDRVHPVSLEQLTAALAPGQRERALELIEDGKGADDDAENSDVFGLVYLRFEETPTRAYEGWFIDWQKFPAKKTHLDGGSFFVAGTTQSAGVQLSQSCVHALEDGGSASLLEAFEKLGISFAVKTSGPLMKADPPFALAKAPVRAAPVLDPGVLALTLVAAERYTRHDVRVASRERKWLLLNSARPRFAVDPDDMEAFFALGILYGTIDPGPDANVTAMPLGLVYARFRTDEPTPREYEGFFWDWRQTEAESYWPSRRAKLVEGRLFVAGSVAFTGVELRKGKIVVDTKKARSEAAALAAGLKKLGLAYDVTLVTPAESGAAGFFGSAKHLQLTAPASS